LLPEKKGIRTVVVEVVVVDVVVAACYSGAHLM
jgi:hypothetical protein